MSKLFDSQRFVLFISLILIVIAACLRLYNLDKVPGSLYWEEAALGYDAYSISQTARDHHGNFLPVVAFPSFGDYKPSGYFYALVPFIKVLGLSDFSVRLPSALAGVAIVIGTAFLVRCVAESTWKNWSVRQLRFSFLVGLLVAGTSPWLIQFSRGAWEVNLATAFLLWSVLTGLWARGSHKKLNEVILLFSAAMLAAASMYTYHATRVIAPLVLASVFLLHCVRSGAPYFSWNELLKTCKKLFLPGIFFLLLITPLLLSSQDKNTQQRFAETSSTSTGQYVQRSNTYRQAAEGNRLMWLFSHRYLMLAHDVSVAFLSHFSVDFLFVSGDQNVRHESGFSGVMLYTDVIWLFVGLVSLGGVLVTQTSDKNIILLLLWWIFIGLLPASLTQAYPHALRILPVAPVFLVLVSLGIVQAVIHTHCRISVKFFYSVWLLALLATGVIWMSYWRYYMKVYPVTSQASWQYGYAQMITELTTLISKYPEKHVYVTREYGRPAMYYWFYTKTDPRSVQRADRNTSKDQGEFLQFEQMTFINSVNEAKNGIVASSLHGFEQLSKQYPYLERIFEVKDARGSVVWVISVIPER